MRSTLSAETLAQLRRLHFSTRRLANQSFAGQYRSAFRGHGLEFEEVREYLPGDEIRSIDWKVTARTGKPFIKSYREERELAVMIALDLSASTRTGTRNQLRESLIASVGAALTMIAYNNNDKVGLLTFSDAPVTYLPPRKARSCVWRILHETLARPPRHLTTNITANLRFLNTVLKRSSVIFIISDFFDTGFDRELAILSRRHDVTAVTVNDPADRELPNAGLVTVAEPEGQKLHTVDTADPAVRAAYSSRTEKARTQLTKRLQQCGVDHLPLSTAGSFQDELHRYFAKHRRR